jgi:hypothetical protein
MYHNKLKLKETLGCSVVRKPSIHELLNLKGRWLSELWRNGEKIGEFVAFNDITVAAKNSLFDTFFNGATQVTPSNWCAGLINAAGFTGYNVATDTMSSHPGWAEWTNYSQANRVAWGQGATAGGGITNASPIVFDITAGGTIEGLFITTNNVKGGTTGLLWSAASYTSPPVVSIGDEIRSIYGLSA